VTAKSSFDPLVFIREQTEIASPPIVPEVKLHLATEITPLWQMTEDKINAGHLPPPFWAFAWSGGQGVARYVLDHPETVRGLRILDFAAGSGMSAIAAMKAGAVSATAADIDPLALHAIDLNAQVNETEITITNGVDLSKAPQGFDIILVGDVCYQLAMATQIMRWLWLCVAAKIRVLLGDPGRAYVPESGLHELARYTVPTSRELEDRDSREVKVWDVGLPND
jgi:predicted nicotinamide N-methyase